MFRGPFSMPSLYFPIYAQTTVCVISCAGVHWTKIRFFKPGINLTLHSSRKSPMGDLGGRSLISAVPNRIVHLREKRINKVLFPVIRITTKVQMFESVPRTLNWLYFLFLQMNRCAAPNTKNIHYDQTLHSPKVPLGGFRGPLPYFCGFKPHCA